MDIVDARIHLWQAEAPNRLWPPGRAGEAQKPYPISKETVLFHANFDSLDNKIVPHPVFHDPTASADAPPR